VSSEQAAGARSGKGGYDMSCEPLIDAERAAVILGLHSKTVKRLAQVGRLPGFKIGRVWRFRESSLDEWVRQGLECSRHSSPRERKGH
jgi:excisionase family DNA binding protein